MIAMQYSFTLPADYDMSIIDRRIADKGPLLDNLPNLRFKAYLTARRRAGNGPGSDNLYAPFYVWNRDEGLADFVCGPGFAGVAASFDRPSVRTWIVWQAALAATVTQARFASREILGMPEHVSLADLRRRDGDEALAEAGRGGVLASVAAFEPTTWTRVRFRLWAEAPQGQAGQVYQVGHLSLPQPAE